MSAWAQTQPVATTAGGAAAEGAAGGVLDNADDYAAVAATGAGARVAVTSASRWRSALLFFRRQVLRLLGAEVAEVGVATVGIAEISAVILVAGAGTALVVPLVADVLTGAHYVHSCMLREEDSLRVERALQLLLVPACVPMSMAEDAMTWLSGKAMDRLQALGLSPSALPFLPEPSGTR